MPPSRAFGLMEVMVVLGVVAALGFLLLPVAARLRARSQQITCLSHLRQIHAAMVAYAADHQGYFPKAHYLDPEGNQHWIGALQEGHYTPRIDERRPRTSIHFCPSSKKPPNIYGRSTPSTANYGANRSILGFLDESKPGGRHDRSTPLNRVRDPGTKLLLFEYGGTYAFKLNITNFSAPNYIPGHPKNVDMEWSDSYRDDAVEGRHGPTINVIHVDGSAATLLPDDFLNIPAEAWAP